MYYDFEVDFNYFSFYIKDVEGDECKVVFFLEKLQDFEFLEQIVLIGFMKGDEFVAIDMFMKCFFKYKEEEVYIKSEV